MRITKLLIATMIGAALTLGVGAQAKEQMGEAVDMKSLPANIQQAIKAKAAGGEIVRVKREDDTNGKWNYEVVVKTNGKQWGFEVGPDGKLLKKRGGNKE
ncbi:MAG: hypothetical protein ABI925_05085 [Verrucomicrobiota bacterium]